MDGSAMSKKSVAVVGGGISGISAAYNLWKFSQGRIGVTIHESAAKLGGHSFTVRHPSIHRAIDIGFQVFNDHTYPTFNQFLRELGVEACGSNMSFAVETSDGFSWGSRSTKALMSSFWQQPGRMTKFAMGLSHFHSVANAFIQRVEQHKQEHLTLTEFMDKHRISCLVKSGFLVPFASSVWSVEVPCVGRFDAYTVLKFMSNHRLLSFFNLEWKTLRFASTDYVKKFIEKCKPNVRCNYKVSKLRQTSSGKWILNHDDDEYDHVIMALHGDEAGRLDVEPNSTHRDKIEAFLQQLRGIKYSQKIALVHTDSVVMPANRAIWSSWNFKDDVVTYWENSLQPIGFAHDVFVTILHPNQMETCKINPEKYLCSPVSFSHPRDIARNMEIGIDLQEGAGGLFTCGAYLGYGFHEDGYRSGLEVATRITEREHQYNIIQYKEYPQSLLTTWILSPFCSIVDHVFTARLAQHIRQGCIGVQAPRGEMRFFGKSNVPSVIVSIKSYAMVLKCLLRGDIGFAEAYMDGDFTADNLPLLIFYLLQDAGTKQRRWYHGVLASCMTFVRKMSYLRLSANGLQVAKRNIADHYDLGNAFFASFLDDTMTYSSGIFTGDSTCTLKEAQLAKYQRLCVEIGISKDDHVLEIGTGWGGFAVFVVRKTGCRITTITLSHEQTVYTEALIQKEGLEDRITVLEMDYRHIPAKFPPNHFHAVVSIEMIEAVGPSHFDDYFRIIHDCCTLTARVGIQAITRFEDNYDSHKRSPDFINQYIFPGGCLPSLGAISAHATRHGLIITSTLNIGKSYALTLAQWRKTFLRTSHDPSFPYDAVFRRKWDLYFAVCQAAFECGTIQDHQIILEKVNHNPVRLV